MWSLKPVPSEKSQDFLEKGLIPGLGQQICKRNLGYHIMPKTPEEERDCRRSSDLLNATQEAGPWA